MEKQDLELLKKALPMYLNHGLKCRVCEHWNHIFGYEFLLSIDEPKMYNSILSGYSDIFLRPLSDLTKDEKTFDLIFQMCKDIDENLDYLCEFKGNLFETSLSFRCVSILIENHYDVFGLIEKGLAVDINTLKP